MNDNSNILNWERFLSLNYIVEKILDHGLTNSFRITVWKLKDKIFQFISTKLRKLYNIVDEIRYKSKKQNSVLYAFYDLQVSPVTFDIIPFLILAEQERLNCERNSIHLVIVPGSNAGFRMNELDNYQKTGNYDIGHLQWRKNNILVSCSTLLHSIEGVTTCNSRDEASAIASSVVKHVFPRDYTVCSPIQSYYLKLIVNTNGDLPTLQCRDEPRKIINNWLKLNANRKKVITITLRESKYQQKRNSNLKEWGNFVRGLDKQSFLPLIIRDTEAAFDPVPEELDGFTIINEVCFNLELRAALYELSYLNMFVNNGPSDLARFLKNSCTLVFKMITEEVKVASANFYHLHGVKPGNQYPPLSSFHKLVWDNDDYDVLQKEFKKMCTTISMSKKQFGGEIN